MYRVTFNNKSNCKMPGTYFYVKCNELVANPMDLMRRNIRTTTLTVNGIRKHIPSDYLIYPTLCESIPKLIKIATHDLKSGKKIISVHRKIRGTLTQATYPRNTSHIATHILLKAIRNSGVKYVDQQLLYVKFLKGDLKEDPYRTIDHIMA